MVMRLPDWPFDNEEEAEAFKRELETEDWRQLRPDVPPPMIFEDKRLGPFFWLLLTASVKYSKSGSGRLITRTTRRLFSSHSQTKNGGNCDRT